MSDLIENKPVKGIISQPSKCYEMRSTSIRLRNGDEITVMAKDNDCLIRFLEQADCDHFDAERFQSVVVFGRKHFSEVSDE